MTITHDLPIANPTQIKKILILGAECTGKSTFSQDLAKHYQTVYVSEYMRHHLQQKPKGYVCQYQDLLPIAKGQIDSENLALKTANQYLFCDTGLFELMVYADWYFKKCPKEIITHIKNHPYDMIFLTDEQGITWVADGQRDMPHGRNTIRNLFIHHLNEFNLDYVSISGNRQQRVQKAIDAISTLDK